MRHFDEYEPDGKYMPRLSKITIRGFKSINLLENFEMKQLNVLIGANGVGKSNFISFFKLLNRLIDGELQHYVAKEGGPDALLYYGRKKTPDLRGELYFGRNAYSFILSATKDNRLIFSDEIFIFFGDYDPSVQRSLGKGHSETLAKGDAEKKIASYVVPAVESWRVYHFHDTSDSANVKQIHAINDNVSLRPDAANLAAYLYTLKNSHPKNYQMIIDSIRLIAPFFKDFHLRPMPDSPEKIQLEWLEKNSDFPFTGHHLSDGTLRFICLATLLLQPHEKMPTTILIDEPELGLHPYAIKTLAAMITSTAESHQIIISTQSVELVDQFQAGDIIVVDRENNQSTFQRLASDQLAEWLEDYSLGNFGKKMYSAGDPHNDTTQYCC